MELSKAGQISLEELSRMHFHAFFFADGSENRSGSLHALSCIRASRMILLTPVENRLLKKHRKASSFSAPGFEHLELEMHQSGRLTGLMDSIIKASRNKEIAILFDYSEMPKAWYAGLFEYLMKNDLPCTRLTICFSYVPAAYQRSVGFSFHTSARPLVSGSHINDRNDQKALVLGLGFAPEKALYLVRKIKPRSVFLLYADPTLDPEYTRQILKLNQKLIQTAGPSRLIPYPLDDAEKTEEIVSALAFDLRLSHKVLLAPLGPKIFTLICLMLYAKFPDIEIWSTGSAKDHVHHDFPLHKPLVIKSVFVREDDHD